MMSPTKKVMIKKYPSIAGLQEKESQVSDPWGSLFKLIQHIATLLNWDIDTDFFTKPRSVNFSFLVLAIHGECTHGGTTSDNCFNIFFF